MTRRVAVASLVGALLGFGLACSGLGPAPVPADRTDYVGTWRGGPVELRIEPDGMLHYQRNERGNTRSLDAPIQSWHDRGFDAGIGPLVTTFVVDAPPRRDGTVWRMTVDGQALERR